MHKMFLIASIVFVFSLIFVVTVRSQSTDAVSIAVSSVKYEPLPAKAGGYIDLFFAIKNVDTKMAENINLELLPEYPFSLEPGQNATKRITELGSLSSTTIYYKVRVDNNAVNGNNTLKLRYWGSTTTNPNYYVTLSFDILVKSSSNLIISEVKPTTLNPGSQTDVIFKLSNVGNSAIRNLLFEWDEPNNLILPIGSDNRKYIPVIDVSQDLDLKFRIMADPNLAPGIYPLTLKLSHDNGNSTTKVGMIVGGGTDFDIGVESSVGGELSLSIANIGVNNAESISVKLGNQTQNLGKLNKGDFTLVTLSNPQMMFSGASQPTNTEQPANRFGRGNDQNRKLVVEISYTDTTGQRQTVTKDISPSQLTSGSRQQAGNTANGGMAGHSINRGSGLGNIFIVAAVVIAIVGGFYFYRKKRKSAKDET